MKDYKVVAVLWDDHIAFDRVPLPRDPDDAMTPTLTIGFIHKQTKKTLTLVSDLERYEDRDEASYVVILRSCIRSIKEYGAIQLELR